MKKSWIDTVLRLFCLAGLASLTWAYTGESTMAAEQLVLRYGSWKRSLPISDLRQLVETGQGNRLKSYPLICGWQTRIQMISVNV